MQYRKKWELINGPIPKDEFNRTYEIHHIDGNRKNNDITNLKCLSLQEHYDLHLQQGDFAAAFRIGQRMKICPVQKSKLMSLSNKKRLASKNHPFLDEKVREKNNEITREKIKAGTHPFQNRTKEQNDKANKTYATNHNRSDVVKKSWQEYKSKNPDSKRTIAGAKTGGKKTQNTKWFHKENGSHLRAKEDDPRIKDGWILGRFKNK